MTEKKSLKVINARTARTTLMDEQDGLLVELRARLENYGTVADQAQALRTQLDEARAQQTKPAPSQDDVDEADNLVQEYLETRSATATAHDEVNKILGEDGFGDDVKAMLVRTYLPKQDGLLEESRRDFDRATGVLLRHELACQIETLQKEHTQVEYQMHQPREDVIEILDAIWEVMDVMQQGGLTPAGNVVTEVKAAQARVGWVNPTDRLVLPVRGFTRPMVSGGDGSDPTGTVLTQRPAPHVDDSDHTAQA